MKPSIYLFGIFSLVQAACSQTPKKTEPELPKFYWEATTSCPTGYPIDVYSGELYGNAYADLYFGTETGPWGTKGASYSGGNRHIPNKLRVTWLSYIEDCFYHIDTDIDYDKMLEHFQETLYWRNARNELIPEKFDTINVGFAPGGVVVIWLNGTTKTVEIGRYQGKKIEIPQEKVDLLDSHDRLIFQPKYRQETLLNEKIVPLEFQEKHKNEPIPFGLWDEYRNKYNWKIEFSNNAFTYYDTMIFYSNGELNEILGEKLPIKNYHIQSIPKQINILWKDKANIRYVSHIYLNEEEVLKAFKEMFTERKSEKADFKIIIHGDNIFITIVLCSDNYEIPLKKITAKIFTTHLEF